MKTRKVKLGDICTVVSGATPSSKSPEYWNGDIVWITPAELSENSYVIYDSERHLTQLGVQSSSLKPFPAGTVILTSRAPIGKTAIAGREMYCNQGFKNLICSSNIYNKYLYFFLTAKTKYLNSLGRGATFKELSKKIVENIEIDLPEINIQKHRAEILLKILYIIQKKKIQLQKLDSLIKSRFVEMFGEPGIDPYGWGLTTLGKCCELNPHKPKTIDNNLDYSFVPMTSVSENGRVDPSMTRNYQQVCKGFTYFAENDVLFAKITPCMENGKGGIATALINGVGFGSTEFHVLRPIKNISNPYWLYMVTMFPQFRTNAEKVMTGSGGQRRVPITYLNEYRIALPPIKLQEEFATFVQQVDKSKFAVKQSLDKLETLKKSLMQEYFG